METKAVQRGKKQYRGANKRDDRSRKRRSVRGRGGVTGPERAEETKGSGKRERARERGKLGRVGCELAQKQVECQPLGGAMLAGKVPRVGGTGVVWWSGYGSRVDVEKRARSVARQIDGARCEAGGEIAIVRVEWEWESETVLDRSDVNVYYAT